MGDINLDWNDAVSKPLKTIAIKLGLYQLIKDSTRIGQTRRSILYLIFTNHPAKYALSGVIDRDGGTRVKDLTRVRLESPVLRLVTCLTNTNERLDLTLTCPIVTCDLT